MSTKTTDASGNTGRWIPAGANGVFPSAAGALKFEKGRTSGRSTSLGFLKSLVACVSLTLGLLLSGCATTPKFYSQAKPGTDFSKYHTFTFVPLPTSGPTSDPGLMLRITDPARQAVIAALTAKGFTEAEHSQADLAVNLRLASEPRVRVIDWGYRTMPVYGGWGGFYGSVGYRDVDVYAYEERTLTVEIFDTRSKDLVWVGWSKGEAHGPIQAERLQQGIRTILASFPPGTATNTPAAKSNNDQPSTR